MLIEIRTGIHVQYAKQAGIDFGWHLIRALCNELTKERRLCVYRCEGSTIDWFILRGTVVISKPKCIKFNWQQAANDVCESSVCTKNLECVCVWIFRSLFPGSFSHHLYDKMQVVFVLMCAICNTLRKFNARPAITTQHNTISVQ